MESKLLTSFLSFASDQQQLTSPSHSKTARAKELTSLQNNELAPQLYKE